MITADCVCDGNRVCDYHQTLMHQRTMRQRSLERSGINPNLTYYISGPMSGLPEHNFPAFETASAHLRTWGLDIVSPNEVEFEGEPGTLPWQDYLRGDLTAMLKDCEGIILLKGWPTSKGARLELHIAMHLEWPVLYYHDRELTQLH